MEPLPVDAFQLQRRDPVAWTTLLSGVPELADVVVTAVTAEPLWDTGLVAPGRVATTSARRVRRYVLTLAGCSDPITFIAKQTSAVEAMLYQGIGDPPPTAMVACYYAHIDGDDSWVILDDVPEDFPPATWQPGHVDAIMATLGRIHAARWRTTLPAYMPFIPHFLYRPEGPFNWEELHRETTLPIEEGPGAVLSRHAVRHAGRLAPRLLQAAQGLVLMRELGGWPGVLDESHLAAAADLLDDPAPLLATLDDLPNTLLHGAPHPGHWRLTVFGEQYLIDWSNAQMGPGVLDLVAFLEGYPLLFDETAGEGSGGGPRLRLRELSPLFEETATDTYLLTLSAELGKRCPARAIRAAVPAARCLHVLTTWFPLFADWATELPGLSAGHENGRANGAEPNDINNDSLAELRPYLAGVFDRFLQAYHNL